VSKQKLNLEDIKKMSQEEINDNWEDVKPVLIASGEAAPADRDEDDDDE
jgi:hypothetical protein